MEEQGEQECQLVLETQVAPALIRKVRRQAASGPRIQLVARRRSKSSTRAPTRTRAPWSQVGERQSGRVSYGAVDAYLSRRRLMFDRGLLAAMFQEADFRGEGSLVPQHLIAAIAGGVSLECVRMQGQRAPRPAGVLWFAGPSAAGRLPIAPVPLLTPSAPG